MERQPPHLVAVPKDAPAPAPDEQAPEPAGPRSRVALILALLLAVAVGGVLAQTWRASQLEGRVTALEAELGAAREALAAHEAHLDRVREAVGALRQEIESLDSLAAQEP